MEFFAAQAVSWRLLHVSNQTIIDISYRLFETGLICKISKRLHSFHSNGRLANTLSLVVISIELLKLRKRQLKVLWKATVFLVPLENWDRRRSLGHRRYLAMIHTLIKWFRNKLTSVHFRFIDSGNFHFLTLSLRPDRSWRSWRYAPRIHNF